MWKKEKEKRMEKGEKGQGTNVSNELRRRLRRRSAARRILGCGGGAASVAAAALSVADACDLERASDELCREGSSASLKRLKSEWDKWSTSTASLSNCVSELGANRFCCSRTGSALGVAVRVSPRVRLSVDAPVLTTIVESTVFTCVRVTWCTETRVEGEREWWIVNGASESNSFSNS